MQDTNRPKSAPQLAAPPSDASSCPKLLSFPLQQNCTDNLETYALGVHDGMLGRQQPAPFTLVNLEVAQDSALSTTALTRTSASVVSAATVPAAANQRQAGTQAPVPRSVGAQATSTQRRPQASKAAHNKERGATASGRDGSAKNGPSGQPTGSSSRSTLLAAVALQDNWARTIGFPGGPRKHPSMQPGATLTLAQHLGLLPRPPALLSKDEWSQVHMKARLRQHSTKECPICQEDFGQSPQVLLSCAHVFHKSCLASFEQYARVKCCPLCRANDYQKKLIKDGAEAHRQQCAVKIQAAFRGWLARRLVRGLRRRCPPSNARLKRVWAAERLEEQGASLVAGIDAARGDIDALFAELDAGLALSREAASGLEATTAARRLAQEGLTLGPEGSEALDAPSPRAGAGHSLAEEMLRPRLPGGLPARASPRDGPLGGCSDHEEEAEEHNESGRRQPAGAFSCEGGTSASVEDHGVDWAAVMARAKARGCTECPICIGRLRRKARNPGSGSGGRADVAWLSCTHVFHVECITAFEADELAAGGVPACPVCRTAGYSRRCLPA